jgi:type III secretion protein R
MEFLPNYITELVLLFGCTAFLKVAAVFSIVRYGLGLPDIVFGMIAAGAALVIACVVPQVPASESLAGKSVWVQAETQRKFLTEHSDQVTVERFEEIRSHVVAERTAVDPVDHVEVSDAEEAPVTKPVIQSSEPSIQSLLAGFVVRELGEAFQLGLLLLLPLVVVDILVVNVLAVLGITQISAVVVSLPLKLALFIGAGGWDLLVTRLLNSYGA